MAVGCCMSKFDHINNKRTQVVEWEEGEREEKENNKEEVVDLKGENEAEEIREKYKAEEKEEGRGKK